MLQSDSDIQQSGVRVQTFWRLLLGVQFFFGRFFFSHMTLLGTFYVYVPSPPMIFKNNQ